MGLVSGKTEGDYMKPHEISMILNVSYSSVLALLRSKALKAKKEKGKWTINTEDFNAFKLNNTKKIKSLQSEYVKLYRGGLTHYQIQKRVSKDFKKRQILGIVKGFAEIEIYESLKPGENI
jgi:hypothetical protein